MSAKPHIETMVYIVGADSFFNGALSYVIEKELCCRCTVLKKGESIPEGSFLLIDSLERDFEKELSSFPVRDDATIGNPTVALFNLPRGKRIESRAFLRGIKGFFYQDDSLSQILRGLRALQQGETWISRDILISIVTEKQNKPPRTIRGTIGLSKRELEVLALVSIGSSNVEIAHKLLISPNTVKVHLYRIYQKIKVPNRFQAALWAAQNDN